jgi:competence protein ComEA
VPDIPRSHLIIYGIAALAVLVFGIRQVAAARRQDQAASGDGAPAIALHRAAGNGGGRVVVQVAGAVRRPGVYRMGAGGRVNDAVRRAGGVKPQADLTQVNLAQKLEDGRQIIVPARTPVAAVAAAPGGAAPAPAGPVNLNTATLEQLDSLDGIGPITAQHILDYRKAHGGFANVNELDNVPGIGPTTLTALRDEVTA